MSYILVFGDSITYGSWDFEKGGWVKDLENFAIKKLKQTQTKIFSLSIILGLIDIQHKIGYLFLNQN